jgi:3D (Asp-Asp-Asp) domain-containing protein
VRKVLLAVTVVLLLTTAVWPQHGSAPPGYYPPTYSGDTWTGTVSAVDDQMREITLTYTKNSKTQTFTGVLKAGLKGKRQDGTEIEVKPSDFPIGSRLLVYYTEETKKVQGQKIKTNEIFKYGPAPEK